MSGAAASRSTLSCWTTVGPGPQPHPNSLLLKRSKRSAANYPASRSTTTLGVLSSTRRTDCHLVFRCDRRLHVQVAAIDSSSILPGLSIEQTALASSQLRHAFPHQIALSTHTVLDESQGRVTFLYADNRRRATKSPSRRMASRSGTEGLRDANE